MNKVKIEIVEAKGGQRFLKGVQSIFIAALIVPDLAGDENIRPGQPGCDDAFATPVSFP